jgi:hypothetical protein
MLSMFILTKLNNLITFIKITQSIEKLDSPKAEYSLYDRNDLDDKHFL